MNNNVTIAYRANLYSKMLSKYNVNLNKLNQYFDFYKDACLHHLNEEIAQENLLYGMFTCFETFLTDSAVELLISYPAKIGKEQKNSVEVIADCLSLQSVIKYSAEAQMNSLAYKSVSEYINGVYVFFGEKFDNKVMMGTIIEGKEVRNAYMHNGGICGSFYFKKAGEFAKEYKENEKIPLEEDYLKKIKNAIVFLFDDFKKRCIEKYRKDNPIDVFKEMWEYSCLNEHVAFDEMWHIEKSGKNDTIVGKNVTYAWSSSQQLLLNFFKLVHGGDYEKIGTHGVEYALQIWEGYEHEETLIRSWLDAPFYIP